jgi:hypothetical protein
MVLLVKRRSPAEKKRLSYQRDHRDAYGESPHASRKWIPRRKRMRARVDRRRVSQGLAPGAIPLHVDDGDHLEIELLPPRDPRQPWRKTPDRPLGEHVALTLAQRERHDRPDHDGH